MSINVSYSALNDYLSCKQRAYYRIFEAGESIPSREMLMGTITHKVLEKAWDNKEKADKMVYDLCLKYNIDAGGITSVQHFVSTYFERFQIMVRPDDKIEKRFKVKLADDVYLVGIFDRVTKGTVIDWKTTAKPPKKVHNNIQFILYDLAYSLIYNRKAEGLYLAALSDGSLVRYQESQEHRDTVIHGLIPEYIRDVKNKTFTKNGLFNGACFRCPYKIPCLGGGGDVMVYPATPEE